MYVLVKNLFFQSFPVKQSLFQIPLGAVHKLRLQEEGGRWSKKLTFCKLSYHRKCKRRGVGGQKKPNFVNVVCERPLIQRIEQENIFLEGLKSFLNYQTDPKLFNYSFVRLFTDCLIHAITIEENIVVKEIKNCVKNNIKVKKHFINIAKLCLEQL